MFRNVMTYLGLGPDEEYDDGYLYDDEPDQHVDSPAPIGRDQMGRDQMGRDQMGRDQMGRDHMGRDHMGREPMVREHSHVTSVLPSRSAPSAIDDSSGAVTAVRPLRNVGGRSEPARRASYGESIDLDADETFLDGGRSASSQRARDSSSGRDSAFGNERPLSSGIRTRSSERSMATDRLHNEPVVRPVPIQRTKPRSLSPQSFGDAKTLADELKDSVPVVMNLRDADRDVARRLIDFASGVCYSIDATMEKIAPQVFLLVPDQVVVSDEERRRLEERGFDR